MPQFSVFACPSCGASLSVEEGAATTQCQFCGNTVIVPAELRKKAPGQPASLPRIPQVMVGGMSFLTQLPRLREMGDLVRAGRTAEAARIYQDLFGVSERDATLAVEQLTAGQPVMVNQTTTGGQESGIFRLDQSGLPQIRVAGMGAPPVISTPFGSGPAPVVSTPMAMSAPPVIVSSGRSRSSAGCVLLTTFLFIAIVIAGAGLAVAAFMPGGFSVLQNALPAAVLGYPRVVLTFGGEGTGPGLFKDARHVGVDGDGNIYVADYTGGRVQVFDSAGKYQTQWTVGEDKKVIISGLAVARDGSLYLVYNSEIRHHDGQTGALLGTLDYVDGWGFEDVSIRPDGGLVAAWYKNRDDLVVFNSDGETEVAVQEAIASVSGDSELSTNVATDGLGNIYALGSFNHAVFVYGPDGKYLSRFGSEGDAPGQFQAPGDIAVDNQSQVYVSDIKGIQVFDASGRYLSVINPPEFGYAYGMGFDDANALYVVANNNKVYKFQLSAPGQ